MCAQFMIKARIDEILKRFRAILIPLLAEYALPDRVLPFTPAPVVRALDGERVVEPMQFSMVPSWLKERRPKFATHNARLETLAEKPVWRGVFAKQRCLVPMTHFIEPIYKGEHAGTMVRFSAADDAPLAAAALWDSWRDSASGEELHSFAVITGEPGSFVRGIGHDRQPLFLDEAGWERWLEPRTAAAPELYEILAAHRVDPVAQVATDRPMKPGWEKRIPK